MPELFESPLTGEELPVVGHYVQHHWSARVLYQVEAAREWVLTWTDGINVWYEEWDRSYEALARLAALAAAVERESFLRHRASSELSWRDRREFVDHVEHFIDRTVEQV